MVEDSRREGSLEAPTRHAIAWKDEAFYDETDLFGELERVFDICHGCRRCVSLCQSFPTLFDLVDESETLEVDGVAKKDYWQVVDHCYLCDLCFLTKCPYVPPHEWNIDFPHLMLRAKAVKHRQGKTSRRDKILTSTDTVGKLAGIPVVSAVVNAANTLRPTRAILQTVLGVHKEAPLPSYHGRTLRKRLAGHKNDMPVVPTDATRGKVALFATCYGNYNEPQLGEDLVAIFEHNGIPVITLDVEQCCGMPKLELGDLAAVERAKDVNIPAMIRLIESGWDIVAPVPSCVLMFKQELPLMFPDDADVQRVKKAIYDPFEYLMLRHKDGKLNTEFRKPLGKVAYHASCHLRVQRIGLKTRDFLELISATEVAVIERCSGHDGTYAVKKEYYEVAKKICRPVVNRVEQAKADVYASDCPMAGHQIANGMANGSDAVHPLTLVRQAYAI